LTELKENSYIGGTSYPKCGTSVKEVVYFVTFMLQYEIMLMRASTKFGGGECHIPSSTCVCDTMVNNGDLRGGDPNFARNKVIRNEEF